MIDFQRAVRITEDFSRRRIVVLGDLMLDEFIWGEVRRISPEAPVPVVEVRRETLNLGGAGNVVSNLRALGAEAVPIGLIGADDAALRIRERFLEIGAETGGLITDPARPTTRKTRIVAHSQQMVRADREDRSPVDHRIESLALSAVGNALSNADCLIISDYDKGLLTPKLLAGCISAAHTLGKPVILDPKIRNFSAYREVDLITPNQAEAERASNIEISDDDSLLAAAQNIRRLLACRHVLITRGEHGMSLLEEDDQLTTIPTVAREVYDVTGAGDTVIATLSLALTSGASLREAAVIANHAAGIVVAKIGTATASIDELLSTMARD
ncbi:MAG: D-glycero-beta-D-manno-heptose-7-phosphate kinase [Acidobacteriota bacterium]|nr:MAG: D-glycero-beta-D-manno-heptose-7-phosphate kinase [Acidobacteriota bacterium]